MKNIRIKLLLLLLSASVSLSGISASVSASGSANTSAAAARSIACSESDPAVLTAERTLQAFPSGTALFITSVSGLNVYSGPSVSDRILTLGPGDQLISFESTNSGWTRVSCGGHESGWVNTAELTASSTAVAAPQEHILSGRQAKVLTNALTVYAAPSAVYSNILTVPGGHPAYLYKGQVVDAVGYTSNGFTKIQYDMNGTVLTGYVRSAWVKVSARPENLPKETFKKIYGYSAQIRTEYEAVSLYASARTDSSILTTLQSGQVITILSQSDHWYRVTLNVNDEMITGYIYRTFAKRADALSNLRLNKTELTLKRRGKYHLTVRGTTGMNIKTSWKSSKKRVISVNKRGYLTAKKSGTAKITCTVKVGSRTRKLTCKIRVKK